MLKALLAAANLLLAAAVIAFAAICLFVRPAGDLSLPRVEWQVPGPPGPPGDDRPLQDTRNPLAPSNVPLPPPGLQLVLLGTLPNPDASAAFFRSGKDEFVAFVGERVGPWRLDEVCRDRAVLSDGRARREVLLQEAPSPRPPRTALDFARPSGILTSGEGD